MLLAACAVFCDVLLDLLNRWPVVRVDHEAGYDNHIQVFGHTKTLIRQVHVVQVLKGNTIST